MMSRNSTGPHLIQTINIAILSSECINIYTASAMPSVQSDSGTANLQQSSLRLGSFHVSWSVHKLSLVKSYFVLQILLSVMTLLFLGPPVEFGQTEHIHIYMNNTYMVCSPILYLLQLEIFVNSFEKKHKQTFTSNVCTKLC